MTATLIAMSRLLAVAAVAILVAVCCDFCSGWRKAKLRGEARTSYGMSRTASKIVTYYGVFFVGACIDVLLHVGRVWQLFGLGEEMEAVPLIASLVSVFLCVIEGISIMESADTKAKKRMGKVAEVAINAAGKSEMIELLARAITAAQENTQKTKSES